MPVGNINWSDETPARAAKRKAAKAKSDRMSEPVRNTNITSAGVVPKAVKNPVARGVSSFSSVKAYNTRPKRTV